jgi:hypothetical protein
MNVLVLVPQNARRKDAKQNSHFSSLLLGVSLSVVLILLNFTAGIVWNHLAPTEVPQICA